MTSAVDIALLALLVLTALAMLRLRNLFAIVMLSGIYSLASAALFTTLDAVDVAFTEASVGAGISTVLMLGTLALTRSEEKVIPRRNLGALAVVLFTGAVLIWGTLDMPHFGDANSPAHSRVTDVYIADSEPKTTVPNIVTAVLASYRGYDTLGETTVILTAGVSVLLIIGRVGRQAGRGKTGKDERTKDDAA